ncbi:porin [Citrobacter portucalensis]|uniref:Porin n=1 Tax=Citrobacter portucalensis TaxID=1639133 RepID=A0ABZ0H1B3_9ENTR|nr:porin [Citrobacter portucalensis]MBJ9336847.1 porin [Citrobacter freundii]MCE9894122.1 porin [Citrobacter portucalensis]MDE9573590.1 porin [Citrobacter portucalensis]MDE9649897.1 porin [Citrobacter portucalensis]MDE9664818.1 porin [Citrobacter portucalensis]
MKKSVVALAVMALGVTSAQAAEIYNKDGNKLDLYGKVKAVHSWSDGTNADETYARLGFRGETQINDQLTGYGQFESQFDASKAEGSQNGVNTRLAFAGLDYGHDVSFDYGRNYGIAYDVGAYTDTLSEFGGDSFEDADRFLTSRTSGVATLRTKNLFGAVDGLNVGAQYQGQDDTNTDPTKQHGNGYGFSLGYDNIADSGVSAIAAYTNSSITAAQKKGNTDGKWDGENAEFWGAGLKYDANAIYVATMYGESHNLLLNTHKKNPQDVPQDADKAQHFEAMAAYVFDFGLRPNVGYVHTRDNNNNDLTEYVALGTDYYFNKNMVADVGYKINLLDGKDGDNKVVAGLTYQF